MRKRGVKRSWRRQVEEERMMVGLSVEDALCWSQVVGVNHVAIWLRRIRPSSLIGHATGLKTLVSLSHVTWHVCCHYDCNPLPYRNRKM